VKGRKVSRSEQRRGCKRLQRDSSSLKLTIDVVRQALGYLQDAPLCLRQFQARHTAQSKQRKRQQRRRQAERKEDQ